MFWQTSAFYFQYNHSTRDLWQLWKDVLLNSGLKQMLLKQKILDDWIEMVGKKCFPIVGILICIHYLSCYFKKIHDKSHRRKCLLEFRVRKMQYQGQHWLQLQMSETLVTLYLLSGSRDKAWYSYFFLFSHFIQSENPAHRMALSTFRIGFLLLS